jgi:ubiquitin carboxyl-terminal hydrolase 9/24
MSSDDNKSPKPSNFREIDDDNLLHQLQIMYTYLTLSEKSDFSPKDFCYSYKDINGNPTNVRAQQDSQEFYNNFCEKIEEHLKKTKYKYIINDILTGKTCSSVKCNSCNYISNRFEDFYNLTLEIKNLNNLNESLKKFVIAEKIDDFKCDNCQQKVTIEKRTSLAKLPNVLLIHLKRFFMNYDISHT